MTNKPLVVKYLMFRIENEYGDYIEFKVTGGTPEVNLRQAERLLLGTRKMLKIRKNKKGWNE